MRMDSGVSTGSTFSNKLNSTMSTIMSDSEDQDVDSYSISISAQSPQTMEISRQFSMRSQLSADSGADTDSYSVCVQAPHTIKVIRQFSNRSCVSDVSSSFDDSLAKDWSRHQPSYRSKRSHEVEDVRSIEAQCVQELAEEQRSLIHFSDSSFCSSGPSMRHNSFGASTAPMCTSSPSPFGPVPTFRFPPCMPIIEQDINTCYLQNEDGSLECARLLYHSESTIADDQTDTSSYVPMTEDERSHCGGVQGSGTSYNYDDPQNNPLIKTAFPLKSSWATSNKNTYSDHGQPRNHMIHNIQCNHETDCAAAIERDAHPPKYINV